jgi:phosphatidylglycerophosphatase A
MTTDGGSKARQLFGSFLGSGLLPIAPGTWGSGATILVFAVLFGVQGWFGGVLPETDVPRDPWVWRGVIVGVLAVLFVAGMYVGDYATVDWGRTDPGPFVMDEVVGQGIALLPLLPGTPGILGYATAFFLFRIFDVWKPTPCDRLESLPGGLGIMADDVAAGLYALIIVVVLPF